MSRHQQDGTDDTAPSVGFFGPFGTFTEQALRTQPDLVQGDVAAFRTVPDVLDAVTAGEVDLGFVPIENSTEGMVNFTLDALAFDHDLVIVREVVLDIHMCLAARPGTDHRRRHRGAVDPGRNGAVSSLPPRTPARRRDPGRRVDRGCGAGRERG